MNDVPKPCKSRAGTRGKPFEAGNPGRVRGSRNHATMAAAALLDGEAEALTRTAINKALEGDTVALRFCLERLLPPRKDAPISIELPPVNSAEDTVAASSAVLAAVAAGECTPDEAGRMMALLTAHRSIIEVGDPERRISALEGAKA